MSKPVKILAQDEKWNRALIEKIQCDILVMNHSMPKHDTLRSLDVPYSDISARIAAKKKIALAFDIKALRILSPRERGRELARIKQMIVLCRKASTPLSVLHAYTPEGARALLRCLGASNEQASQATLIDNHYREL